MLTIKSDRLTLRDFAPSDFEALYATSDDAEYRRYYSSQEMSPESWRGIFGQALASQEEADRSCYQLAVCLAGSGLIGTCGLRIEDTHSRQASLGCAIGREHWGRGYACEAAYNLVDFGFRSLPIHRVYAETNAANARSIALAQRLGMCREAEFMQNRYFRGQWWNTVVYAITRNEWSPARA